MPGYGHLEGQLAPFPRLPAGAQNISGLLLRPFGLLRDDLEIDFGQRSLPRLVTEILYRCTIGEAPDLDFFWDLSSGKRTECLAAIATLVEPSGLSVHLCCPDEACRQELEVDIPVQELANLQRRCDETDRVMVRMGDEEVPVRLPTGRNQQAWLETSFDDGSFDHKNVVETLSPRSSHWEGVVPDEWVQTIDGTLNENDPLVNFVLAVVCPDCGEKSKHEVDLQEVSLDIMRRAQFRLLRLVHRIALYYHWSEEQIFDLPPWRSSHYLALIEEEADL